MVNKHISYNTAHNNIIMVDKHISYNTLAHNNIIQSSFINQQCSMKERQIQRFPDQRYNEFWQRKNVNQALAQAV